MFAIVAVPFDAFQSLPRAEYRWLLMCLARYADKAGRCWPTMRQLAHDARISVASVSRYMARLAELGVFQRQRRPGGRYVYQIAEAYRPRWPGRAGPGVSAEKPGVSEAETQQENPKKKMEEARPRARFAKPGLSYGELPDENTQWRSRLRSWRQSRFWLPLWGPKPTEPGCMAPLPLLQAGT